MEKMAWDGPKWGREVLFTANPDLADILGDMDFNFDNFRFWDLFGLHVSKSGFHISKIRAGLEPSEPQNIDDLLWVQVFELATTCFV